MRSRFPFLVRREDLSIDVPALVDLIQGTQQSDGAIPWYPGHKTDPWDHVESAMGLTLGGRTEAARGALEWLKTRQLSDGSWFAAYVDGKVRDATRESNHAAYVAVGLYHYFLITGDSGFVRHMWPTVTAALDFVADLQAPGGEIYWALSPDGKTDPMALLSGCASICLSLKCGLALARSLGCAAGRWHRALGRLRQCLCHRPQHFNMTKSRFAMDWYYPILGGAVTGSAARDRIEMYWKKFVIQNMGVRCVSDQPWVTVAESSELVLALMAMDNRLLARIVFDWTCDHTFDDGTFWCGFTYPDMVLWPEEKMSWTNAVVLLAADALYELTPAGRLFSHRYWAQMGL